MNIEEILADVNKEGSDPFADLEKETPTDSPPVETPKEEEKEEEKEPEEKTEEKSEEEPKEPIPFHQHPRWIERENEAKALRESNEKITKELEELKARQEEIAKGESLIPEWFKELHGDNQTAWQKHNEREQALKEETKREILEEQEKKRLAQIEETKKWNEWVEGEHKKLEADGLKYNRDELAKFMLDYPIRDAQNNYDFRKSYNLFAKTKQDADPAKSEARKQLADTVTTSTPSTEKKKDYMTAADLRRRSWGNL